MRDRLFPADPGGTVLHGGLRVVEPDQQVVHRRPVDPPLQGQEGAGAEQRHARVIVDRAVQDQPEQRLRIAVEQARHDTGEGGRDGIAQHGVEGLLVVPEQPEERRQGARVLGMGHDVQAPEQEVRLLRRQLAPVGGRLQQRQVASATAAGWLRASRSAAFGRYSAAARSSMSIAIRSMAAPQARRVAPVLRETSATILALTASISASVRVRSTGWRRTAIATDLAPSGTPGPS